MNGDLNVTDSIIHAADNSKATVLVALDQSAAFDMIEHDIFISRLQDSFGVSGAALNWIRTYLIGRSQMVAIGNSRSPVTACQFGVPQGSVLGPLFFTLYIAPVAKAFSSQLFFSVSPDIANYLTNLGDCLQALFSTSPNPNACSSVPLND